MSTGPGDPHVGAFYGHLVARGKARMQAVVAVMRKLLHAMWGMLRSESTWQGERFYGGRVDSVVSAPPQSRSSQPPAERRPPIALQEVWAPRAASDKGAVGGDTRAVIHLAGPPSACILPLSVASTAVG